MKCGAAVGTRHRRGHSLESGTANCRGSGDGSPPEGSRGGAPVGGLRDELPQKLKHFYSCDIKLWANFVLYFCFSVFYF